MSWTDQTDIDNKITNITADIANLEDSIAGSGDKDVQSYSIAGRSLARYSLEEKTTLHKFLTKKLRNFERVKAIQDGDGDPGKHKPRF